MQECLWKLNKLEHYKIETLPSKKTITFYGLVVFPNKI